MAGLLLAPLVACVHRIERLAPISFAASALVTGRAVTTTAGFDSVATYRHSGHHSPAKYSATCRPAKRLHSTRAPLWFRREAPENRHCCGCVGAANVDSRHSIVRRSAQTTSSRSVRGGRLGAYQPAGARWTCAAAPPALATSARKFACSRWEAALRLHNGTQHQSFGL